MIKHVLSILIVGAGITACSSLLYQNDQQYAVDGASGTSIEIDSLVAPYSRTLAKEMNLVIGQNKADLLVDRPNSGLGQWLCDGLVQLGKDSLHLSDYPVTSLLNTGGLRAPMLQGDITVGAVFKIMPFDNRIVALRLPASSLEKMADYLTKKGGEPISGMTLVAGKLKLVTDAPYFWVVTSDFLANGGDNMLFFQDAVEKRETVLLLRDFMLNAVKKQQIIDFVAQERISW